MLLDTIIAHRGCSSLAPENTLASIRKAYEVGVRAIEIDVVLLGDGYLVIYHDQSLKRCTNGKGKLLASTLADLKALDAGSWFSQEFAGESIPTLIEALVDIQRFDLILNLEIKTYRHRIDALVLPSTPPLLRALKKHWHNSDKLVLSSFNFEALQLCYRLAPEYNLALLFKALPINWLSKAQAIKALSIHIDGAKLKPAQIDIIKQAGYELYCYTVNHSELATRLWSWGVDGIFTDYPQNFIHT